MNAFDPKIILNYLSNKCKAEEWVQINLWMEENEQNKKMAFRDESLMGYETIQTM